MRIRLNILLLSVALLSAGCHGRNTTVGMQPAVSPSADAASELSPNAVVRRGDSSEPFIGDWLWTEPLSLQLQTNEYYYDIKATAYGRIKLNTDRSATVAVRIVNETEQDFKRLCSECVASGDVANLTKLKPFFTSYSESPAKWSVDKAADGDFIIISIEKGNILRYRYSLNDEKNMMTLTLDGGQSHIYVRLH